MFIGASLALTVLHATIRSSRKAVPAPAYELIGSLPRRPDLSPLLGVSYRSAPVPWLERAVVLHYLYGADYYLSRSSANAAKGGERHGDIDT